LSGEDRAFLEKALEEAFGSMEDPNQVMLEAINQIKADDRTEASIVTALEVIDRLCDDVDCARNVEKLGGIQPLLDLVTAEGLDKTIRIRTHEILALLFSNNENIQEAGVKRGALPLLLCLVQACPVGSEERGKAFRALVALVRPIKVHEETLLRQLNGADLIASCLDAAEDLRTREKAMSFVSSLVTEGRLTADEVGRFATCVASLFGGDISEASLQYCEILAACAASLTRAFPANCSNLEAPIQARIAHIKDSDSDSIELGNLQECLGLLRGQGSA
jgi:hypothetical protein